MKFIVLSAFIVGLGSHVSTAQTKVVSFASAKAEGLSVSDLDIQYKSALHSDTSLAVFKTEEAQTAFIKAYQSYVREIGVYLKTNGITWSAPTLV